MEWFTLTLAEAFQFKLDHTRRSRRRAWLRLKPVICALDVSPSKVCVAVSNSAPRSLLCLPRASPICLRPYRQMKSWLMHLFALGVLSTFSRMLQEKSGRRHRQRRESGRHPHPMSMSLQTILTLL